MPQRRKDTKLQKITFYSLIIFMCWWQKHLCFSTGITYTPKNPIYLPKSPSIFATDVLQPK